jgi:hypothetical protein
MNCIIKHVVEWKKEGARRRRRRHKQPLYDRKERKGYRKLKSEALDSTVQRSVC